MNNENQQEKRLLEFYGTECAHCIRMRPLIERFERESGLQVEKYEVWHNPKNAELMQLYDKSYCGGVPFFYNTASNKWICGAVPYEELKAWAQND